MLALAWAGKDKDATQKAMRELLAAQRADGGWPDIDSMESGAYATGKALFALQTAGLSASDAAYERAVRAGFPHGFDQWISAAGSSWATMVLSQASQARPAMASMGR